MVRLEDSFARVANGLYMGSKPPPDHRLGLVFSAIVLCAMEYQPGHGSFGRAIIIRCPIDDAVLSEREYHCALAAARDVARLRRMGHRVLVTCAMGLNRSGLVTAMSLILCGSTAKDAIRLVRLARTGEALFNKHFVQVLHDFEKNHRRAA